MQQEVFLKAYSYEEYIEASVAKILLMNQRYNNEDKEDLSQDILIKVAKGFRTYESQENASIETWIGTIIRHHVISFLRNKKNTNNVDLDIVTDVAFEQQENEYSQTPEKLYLKKEEMEYLWYNIDNLNENQRKALLLFANEGKSYEEIAKIMNTSVSSVKSLIFRSREKLRHKYVA